MQNRRRICEVLPLTDVASAAIAYKRLDVTVTEPPTLWPRLHAPQEDQHLDRARLSETRDKGGRRRHLAVSFISYDLGYIDLEQRTLQTIDNPFGTRLSPMS
jgi:hypothetical protein